MIDAAPPVSAPAPAGGLRGAIATALRSVGSGYATMTNESAHVADRALAHPIDGIAASTRWLRDATEHVPVLSKVTAAIDKFGGVGVGAMGQQVVEGYEHPGNSISSIAHKAADLLDGQNSGGWLAGTSASSASDGARLLRASDTGELLASLGIR